MAHTVIDKKVPSSNGKNMLSGVVFVPDGEIRGYFHVVHGMTDHISRYAPLMTAMADEGYITFGYDHLGHGHTANDDSELGFIADKGGDELLVRDVKVFSDAIIHEFGDHPYYLLGHSMGSFIVRLAAQKYVKPDKLIIMGTGGPNPVSDLGLALCDIIKIIKGSHGYSNLIENIAFGSYNSKFNESEGPHAWLTKVEENRKLYAKDKYCTFRFTVSAMHDLINLNKLANRSEWFEKISKRGFPILLISGSDDPVGENGKKIYEVYDKLISNGALADMKLYTDCRHEILNDTCSEEVISDIKKFIEKKQ